MVSQLLDLTNEAFSEIKMEANWPFGSGSKIAALLFTDPDEITMNNIEERTIGVDDDNHKFDMNICDKKL